MRGHPVTHDLFELSAFCHTHCKQSEDWQIHEIQAKYSKAAYTTTRGR